VAFFLAWLVVYPWLLQEQDKRHRLLSLPDWLVRYRRADLVKALVSSKWVEKLRTLIETVDEKMAEGKIDPDERNKQKEALEDALAEWQTPAERQDRLRTMLAQGKIEPEEYERHRKTLLPLLKQKQAEVVLPSGLDVKDVAFAFGPLGDAWQDSRLACRYGLVLMLPLALLYAPSIWAKAVDQAVTPFFVLEVTAVFFAPFFLKWLLYAFFLGYFFPALRGSNGWQKGLTLALGIAACTVPQDLLFRARSTNDLIAVGFDVGQTVLFLTVLGLWLDARTLRQCGYGWRRLLITHNLSALAAYGSTVLVAISAAITTIITGQVTAIVTALVNVILPNIGAAGLGR